MTTRLWGPLTLGILLALAGESTAEKKAAPKGAPATAKAAPAKAPAAPSATDLTNEATKGLPQKPKVIDFEDETIRGTLTKPEGDFIDSRKGVRQKSLIKVRRHFVPELLKSGDNL
jgi:hypothetical protein